MKNIVHIPFLEVDHNNISPRGLLMIHEGQAWKNHGQSLTQLAQRGGLSWAEALAIIEGKNWRDAIQSENEAETIVKKLIVKFIDGMGGDNI